MAALIKINKLMAHLDANGSVESKSDDQPSTLSAHSTVSHKITDVKVGEIPNGKSIFVDPKRMHFVQDGKKRKWDLVESMGAVAALCYHAERKSFLFVKQFRAPVYYQRMKEGTLNADDAKGGGHQVGCTVELTAGLLDKPDLSPVETMHEELKEEVGYKVPLEEIEFVTNYRHAVGILGTKTSIFYAKIDESMRIGDGGGSAEENELIELVWIPVKESRKFVMESDDVPPGMKFAVFWFYFQYPELCKELK